jgi:Spy/CpxP family protein refolding chaperone
MQMSERSRNTPSDSNPNPGTLGARGSHRRLLAGLLTGGVIGGLLAGAVSAWSHSEAPGGWHGRGWCRTHTANPAGERERLEFAADWVLNKIQATDAQREQVKGVLGQALQDLAPLRDRHRQHRDALAAALGQPAVDRAALEELRRAELELAEQASTRIVTALADIADALTPEQRAELLKLAEQFRH